MGAFHFFLPQVFHWARYVAKVPAPIRWGLFSINVFFSTLLLWGGILTVVTALKRPEPGVLQAWVILGMGAFWLVNVSYQVAFPFPVARVGPWLLAFSVCVAVLYALCAPGAFSRRKRRGAGRTDEA
jgi:hypothetical protein